MIKNVSISVCDNCDTVSFSPEYTPCINCGRLMVVANFVRQPTPRAVDEGDSAPLQAESTPEVLSIEEADTTPALRN